MGSLQPSKINKWKIPIGPVTSEEFNDLYLKVYYFLTTINDEVCN